MHIIYIHCIYIYIYYICHVYTNVHKHLYCIYVYGITRLMLHTLTRQETLERCGTKSTTLQRAMKVGDEVLAPYLGEEVLGRKKSWG